LSVLGTRSRIRVFSILSLLSTLLTILSPSSAGKGSTIGVGGGSYKGTKSYIKSNIAAKWAAGPLEFAFNLLI
jgi:hypothetical protein